MMTDDLATLLEAARSANTTAQHKEEQRRTFAFGNTAFENPRITREMVDRAADRIAHEQADVEPKK